MMRDAPFAAAEQIVREGARVPASVFSHAKSFVFLWAGLRALKRPHSHPLKRSNTAHAPTPRARIIAGLMPATSVGSGAVMFPESSIVGMVETSAASGITCPVLASIVTGATLSDGVTG